MMRYLITLFLLGGMTIVVPIHAEEREDAQEARRMHLEVLQREIAQLKQKKAELKATQTGLQNKTNRCF